MIEIEIGKRLQVTLLILGLTFLAERVFTVWKKFKDNATPLASQIQGYLEERGYVITGGKKEK